MPASAIERTKDLSAVSATLWRLDGTPQQLHVFSDDESRSLNGVVHDQPGVTRDRVEDYIAAATAATVETSESE